MQPLRPQGHLAPPRLTTMWPISPAAPRPSQGLPSRIRPPPTPVPQKTPIRLRELAPGAEVELGFGRDLDVIADLDRRAKVALERLGEGEALVPVGQVARAGDDAGLLVGVALASRPRCRPGQKVSTPAPRRLRAAPRPSPRRRRPARPWSASAGGLRRGPRRSSSTIAVWILVPPRSIPPRKLRYCVVHAGRPYWRALWKARGMAELTRLEALVGEAALV